VGSLKENTMAMGNYSKMGLMDPLLMGFGTLGILLEGLRLIFMMVVRFIIRAVSKVGCSMEEGLCTIKVGGLSIKGSLMEEGKILRKRLFMERIRKFVLLGR
jgi:hypothetical protein